MGVRVRVGLWVGLVLGVRVRGHGWGLGVMVRVGLWVGGQRWGWGLDRGSMQGDS